MLFTELSLCDSLLDGLQAMNFKETTPIQEQAIPVILEKKDVIACAQTGTGKTAAFLLPLLDNLQTDAHDETKINAIIMAPTRELAQQIDQQMEGFSYFTPFSSVAVYGGNDGEAWDTQKKGLMSGADVVISTPGRLLSHINLYNIDFSGVKYFILDEADRMLDMGFHEDIMKIEKLLPKDRQTIMFSATMPPKIQQLAKTILHNPVDITIAISRPPETILQSVYICHEAQKINIVKHLFKEKAPNKVILFSGSKQKVKEIAKILNHQGLSAGEMHSDLDQTQRNHVMHEFKNERVSILVATDIVARGIDIDDISLVINFDVPYDAEDYVHRIGRTARAGDSGMAITFVSLTEQYRFSKIEEFLGKKIYRIPVPAEFGETPEYNPVRDNRRGGPAARNSKGGNRKGERPAKRDGKPSEAKKPHEKRADIDTQNTGETGELKKKTNPKGRVKNRLPIEDSNQQSESGNNRPRKEKAQNPNTQENSKNERLPREKRNEEQQPNGEQRQNTRGRNNQQPKERASRQEGASKQAGKEKAEKTERPDNQGQESARKKLVKKHPKRESADLKGKATHQESSQTTAPTTDTKKSKKWSWWPFGKK